MYGRTTEALRKVKHSDGPVADFMLHCSSLTPCTPPHIFVCFSGHSPAPPQEELSKTGAPGRNKRKNKGRVNGSSILMQLPGAMINKQKSYIYIYIYIYICIYVFILMH